jgi:hypothetical protein
MLPQCGKTARDHGLVPFIHPKQGMLLLPHGAEGLKNPSIEKAAGIGLFG